MALMSDPIPVADADAWSFTFSNYISSVSVQVRFFTDLAGETELSPLGTGSRDLTATSRSTAYSGRQTRPTASLALVSNLPNGTIVAQPDGEWTALLLGGGLGQVTIAAAVNVTPGTAVTYRIVVEADGYSAPA